MPEPTARPTVWPALHRCLLGLVCCGLTALSMVARAEGEPAGMAPSFALIGPRALAGGSAFSVTLLVTNPHTTPIELTPALSLSALVETNAGTLPVDLLVRSEDAGARVLPAGGFTEVEYRAALPLGSEGVVLLQLVDLAVEPVWFRVESADDEKGGYPLTHPEADAPARGGSKSGRSKKKELIDRILGGLSTYEPIYFIAGGDFSPVTAKFQLSGQYRILLEPSSEPPAQGFLAGVERVAEDLYAGYTQTTLWELSSPSAPFRDSSFRPAFYYWNDSFDETYRFAAGPWSRLGVQMGFEHESNGQSGDDSRSLNTAFVRPVFTFGAESQWHLTVAPKIYAYLEKSENRDIDDYRGYVDLLVKVGRLEGVELTATLRKGAKKDYGSAQLDVSYPIALLARRLGAFLQLQYFYGYGDTLLTYDENAHSRVWAGIMIVPYGAFYR